MALILTGLPANLGAPHVKTVHFLPLRAIVPFGKDQGNSCGS
jgi:hypothetical protein